MENSAQKKRRGRVITADPDQFNAVARAAHLDIIQMNSCEYFIKPEFFNRKDEAKLSFGRNVDAIECHDDCKLVIGFFTYDVFAKVGRAKVMSCKSQFMVGYSTSEPADPEAFKAFCERTGMLAAYAYFRSMFASLSSLSNTDLPPLPMVSVQPMKKPQPSQA